MKEVAPINGRKGELPVVRWRKGLLLSLAWSLAAGWAAHAAGARPQLRYVVIITRHGVRSPTWTAERLNQYSSDPWPVWSVPPGYLTPHGRTLMQLMGAYYREWLMAQHLLSARGCADAERIYIHADVDQRTSETGRALAEALLPGCNVTVHSAPAGSHDALFDPLEAGIATPDGELAAQAVRERLDDPARPLHELHRAAFETLEGILAGQGGSPRRRITPPDEISVSATKKGVQLNEPWGVASTLSENLLLEYTEGMQGKDLGWGRLDANSLLRVLELHALAADLTRRTPYLARARGSNLLAHVLWSMQQARSGKAVAGALGAAGSTVLIVSGHDTNLSNLSGMLGLTWHLPGYLPDDTPPGGALVFSLWQQPDNGQYAVRSQYLAQTPNAMHDSTQDTRATVPAQQEVTVVGCERNTSCPWETFAHAVQEAIDARFVAK